MEGKIKAGKKKKKTTTYSLHGRMETENLNGHGNGRRKRKYTSNYHIVVVLCDQES